MGKCIFLSIDLLMLKFGLPVSLFMLLLSGCLSKSRVGPVTAEVDFHAASSSSGDLRVSLESSYRAVVRTENDIPNFGDNEDEAFYRNQIYWINQGAVVARFSGALNAFKREMQRVHGIKEGDRKVKAELFRLQSKYGGAFNGLFECIEGEEGMDALYAAKRYVNNKHLALTKYAQWRLKFVKGR